MNSRDEVSAGWWGMGAVVVAMGLVIGWAGWVRQRDGEFGRYVLRPKPASVRAVQVDSNDWLLGLQPEPVVHLRFEAAPEVMTEIARTRNLEERPMDPWLEGRGPAWWSPPLREEGARCFVGNGRRGTEYLVVDRSGTNGWFLLWGI